MRPSHPQHLLKSALLLPLILWGAMATAQSTSDSLSRTFQRYTTRAVQEKLFLHLDRPTYLCGEVMWFKVYAADGTSHRPLSSSKVAYIEVLDKGKHPVLQGKVALKDAIGNGSFLLPSSLASGTYTVRAYTSWMKNFSPDFYYQTSITILNPAAASSQSTARDTISYDVQFFPEGGQIVQGIRSRIGFKIIDNKGRSYDAEGTVSDQKGNIITRFQTLKFGIGSFDILPIASGNSYTATIKFRNGKTIIRNLPPVAEKGISLRLEDTSSEILTVRVNATNLTLAENPIFLLSHTRQQAIQSSSSTIQNGEAKFTINKQNLPAGITHFTVFNSSRQPLAERLYFRRPEKQMPLVANLEKPQYGKREKVSFSLTSDPNKLSGGTANVSVAVYRSDSLDVTTTSSIHSYLWLSSDIKGYIENPDYYFNSTEPTALQAADNLMLTQGWTKFKWSDIFNKTTFRFTHLPEINGHLIRGQMTNVNSGAPITGVAAYLTTPNRQGRLFSAVSKSDGSILFDVKDLLGNNELIVQPNSLQDSTARIELLNPFSTAQSADLTTQFSVPLSTRFAPAITQRYIQTQSQNIYYQRYNSHYKLPAVDTLFYPGKSDEHFNLDDYIRFPTMEDIMREYVPGVAVRRKKDGFHFLVIDQPFKTVFYSNPLVLLDGVPVFNINKIMAIDPLKIQKLDVFTRHYFVGQLMFDGLVSYTSYKGDMAGYQPDAKALLQEYEGLQYQREFYAPQYPTDESRQSSIPDFRHLLYWNPSVNINTGSPASLDFFTGDLPGNYQIVVQGMNNNGMSGSIIVPFKVVDTPTF